MKNFFANIRTDKLACDRGDRVLWVECVAPMPAGSGTESDWTPRPVARYADVRVVARWYHWVVMWTRVNDDPQFVGAMAAAAFCAMGSRHARMRDLRVEPRQPSRVSLWHQDISTVLEGTLLGAEVGVACTAMQARCLMLQSVYSVHRGERSRRFVTKTDAATVVEPKWQKYWSRLQQLPVDTEKLDRLAHYLCRVVASADESLMAHMMEAEALLLQWHIDYAMDDKAPAITQLDVVRRPGVDLQVVDEPLGRDQVMDKDCVEWANGIGFRLSVPCSQVPKLLSSPATERSGKYYFEAGRIWLPPGPQVIVWRQDALESAIYRDVCALRATWRDRDWRRWREVVPDVFTVEMFRLVEWWRGRIRERGPRLRRIVRRPAPHVGRRAQRRDSMDDLRAVQRPATPAGQLAEYVRYFPPCMQRLDEISRTERHLRWAERNMYWRFLLQTGWRAEDVQRHMWELWRNNSEAEKPRVLEGSFAEFKNNREYGGDIANIERSFEARARENGGMWREDKCAAIIGDPRTAHLCPYNERLMDIEDLAEGTRMGRAMRACDPVSPNGGRVPRQRLLMTRPAHRLAWTLNRLALDV